MRGIWIGLGVAFAVANIPSALAQSTRAPAPSEATKIVVEQRQRGSPTRGASSSCQMGKFW